MVELIIVTHYENKIGCRLRNCPLIEKQQIEENNETPNETEKNMKILIKKDTSLGNLHYLYYKIKIWL